MAGQNGTELKTTPLYPLYRETAKLTEFAGFAMPVSFSGILEEHRAVRTAAGLFDVSHMGEVRIAGSEAVRLVERLVTAEAGTLSPGRARYAFVLNASGGVLDDLLVYRLGVDEFLLVPNAANIERIVTWAREVRDREGIEADVDDLSPRVALLALQGPKAATILGRVAVERHREALMGLKPFRFAQNVIVAGVPVLLASRTGYTGEDGFELMLAAEEAPALWQALLEAGSPDGLVPAGLGARDTLRLEAGLPLYGQELTPEVTPLEAGLEAFVRFGKAVPFIGEPALRRQKEEGVPRRLVGLVLEGRAPARSGYAVYPAPEAVAPAGSVTSGAPSPTLGRPIAMALVAAAHAGEPVLFVDVRGRRVQAEVVPLPFYRRSKATGG
ncbi:glycine cleavage system aminomethyltransferase GcvT [Hydrogenibacillus sp. N12]|uniref:glycine cleavage system aminomethyltransferase GcvT n=1 Tax=Hydrogenibacillus sp. N12 TaxID=2866627 RepID=UPI001C7D0014|nr:glycine cleavage system aminomethyltransferase GcvT [Hydrogenibacillus sp. N12]QZA34008.1 glycine cleavage system aminomethyltransferase GcvT [Hydrogenibacillus sp. N12]